MVFNEWFGELTNAQWRAYRRHNISPSDHDWWSDTGWDGDAIAGWVCTLAALGCSPNDMNGPAWASRWDRCGYTSAAAARDVVSSIVASTGRRPIDVRPGDAHLATARRQATLFESVSPSARPAWGRYQTIDPDGPLSHHVGDVR